MTHTKTLRRSFAGGEITPEMFGRIDNVKNQTGLALCRNAVVLPHGPVTKRPGDAFVNIVKAADTAVRLLPFVYSTTQSMVLEFGHQYIRFHTNGATLLEPNGIIVNIVGNLVTHLAHGYAVGDWVYIGGRFFVIATTPTGNTYTVVDTITGTAATPFGPTAARVYTIVTPYAAADLFSLRITQDADVFTISYSGYATRELRRLGATNWTLTAPALGGALAQPSAGAAPTVVATAGTGTAYNKDHYYKITTISGPEESMPTAQTIGTNDLSLPGSKNTASWVAAVGVTTPSYRVYKAVGGGQRLYGYVGETSDLSFVDDNITPDFSRNPPSSVLRLDTAGNYPTAVTYFDQRRVFAGQSSDPQSITMTRPGTESALTVSTPSQSGDAIQFRIKAQQQNAIRHLVPLDDLLALSASCVWRIFSNADGAILPSTVSARPQSYDGCNEVRPVLTGSAVLFVENNGKRVRDISYSTDQRSYVTDDRSIMAPHLFDDYTLVDACFQRNPDKIAWFVRSDGTLLSMTYLPEQQVFAWAQHVTAGTYESVCTVPENNQDVVYAVVRRTLAGVTTRVVERMVARQFATQGDAFFVDCGLSYSGPAVTVLTGYWHLEGKTVAVLADGAVVTGKTITGGTLTLDVAASKVQVGLGFVTDIQTVPLAIDAAAAYGFGTVKAIDDAYLRVNRTGVLKVGPDVDHLRDLPIRTNEPYDSPPNLKSEELSMMLDPDWTTAAQMWIRSGDPVPFTLSALTMQVSLAG